MLEAVAWISIVLGFASAFWIAWDEAWWPQKMAVMSVVWPVSGLYFSLAAVWAYRRVGRPTAEAAECLGEHGQKSTNRQREPSSWQVAVGTSHCGAGCMLADVVSEFVIASSGFVLFGSVLWTEYIIDFMAAWALGIVFQYFAIKPMRDVGPGQAVIAAIKADTLSIAAFQVGMYGWMAVTFFLLFPHPHLTPFDPRYWLMMQIAMICGFFTSYPVNHWLLRQGLKEAM